ncbi:hypothetical protein [Reichenbachiella ulvae]|uniref:Uncharacterized protein n=1 Tax=Reichenbachiella ulvae TaxID=2980104 RepID=A0ABT3CQY1_9BACT|nr:hypothetical protein [Reichenbachiella ulvae]MCV9386067.1 hypothetical protein [Reichenbachiella ulvae]
MRILVVLVLSVLCIQPLVGQMRLTNDMQETEAQLKASTKQVNQFFRRFNGEESTDGNRYYEKDKEFRSTSLRRKYMPVLFDTETGQYDPKETENFVKQITDKKNPEFLDFHQDDWVAEVRTTFNYRGQEVSGLLFMRLQAYGQGYEWIIEDVMFDFINGRFDKDTTESKAFIHPMSHELEFMTLKKALKDNKHSEQYTANDFEPDYLSIFLYELNTGNLKFVTVNDMQLHFFAIEGYYFSLSYFNRTGYNSGWLISSLVPLNSENETKQMKDYIYGKG